MAVVSNFNQQDENDPNKPKAAGSGQAAQITGQGTGYNPSAGTSSGRFTNISSYLQANSGQNLAGRVGENIQQKQTELQNQVGQAKDQFGRQAESSMGQIRAGGALAGDLEKDPVAIAGDETKSKQIGGALSAKYTGPQQLGNITQLQSGAQNLQQLAGGTATEAGRFGLLQQMFNRPTYTGGQQKLDNLLLQSDPRQLKQLQQSRVGAAQVGRELGVANTSAQTQAQRLAEEAANTQRALRGVIDTQSGKIVTDVNSALKTATETTIPGLEQQIKNAISTGNMTQQLADYLGLKAGQSLAGLDSNMIRASGVLPTASSIATPEQQAKLAAYAKLAGVDNSLLPDSYKDQAGTFDPYSAIDKGGFEQTFVGKQQELQNNFGSSDFNTAYNNVAVGNMSGITTRPEFKSFTTTMRNMTPQQLENQVLEWERNGAGGVTFVKNARAVVDNFKNSFGNRVNISSPVSGDVNPLVKG